MSSLLRIHHKTHSPSRTKAAFFDAQAEASWAAAQYTDSELDKIESVFARMPDLQGQTVMEPGCGTGRLTRILSEKVGPQGRVLAMDISRRMCETAWQNTHDLNNVECVCAPMEWVSLPESIVDVVFCHQVFPHFDDKEAAVSRMAGWLRPGGRLVMFHLINIDEINDQHRKAGSAVEHDIMPSKAELQLIFYSAGFRITVLEDQSDRFLLLAKKGGQTARSAEQ